MTFSGRMTRASPQHNSSGNYFKVFASIIQEIVPISIFFAFFSCATTQPWISEHIDKVNIEISDK